MTPLSYSEQKDAAVARLDAFAKGKTIERIEHPVSIGEDTGIWFTDGTSVTFNLEAARIEVSE